MSGELIKLSGVSLYGSPIKELKDAIEEAEHEANGDEIVIQGALTFYCSDIDLNRLAIERKELEDRLAVVNGEIESFKRDKRSE